MCMAVFVKYRWITSRHEVLLDLDPDETFKCVAELAGFRTTEIEGVMLPAEICLESTLLVAIGEHENHQQAFCRV